MPTCQQCQQQFAMHQKIDGVWHNLCSRKYCLTCSPFRGHNTKKLTSPTTEGTPTKTCPKCDSLQPVTAFYARKNGLPMGWCKKCLNRSVIERGRAMKLLMIEYKGGLCTDCGEMPHPACMEFHHLDPDQKDFDLSRVRQKTALTAEVKQELDKCVLVCKNCHAIRHVVDCAYPNGVRSKTGF